MNLAVRTLTTTVIGFVVLGALLFIPAGTLAYWPGWVFLVLFTLLTNGIGLYLAIKDPELLARRVKVGPVAEARPLQRVLIVLSFGAMLVALIVAALDWRLGWSQVSVAVIVIGDVLVALGLGMTFAVMLQNRYAASTIRTMEGQQVISTGLYGIVRHPMYLGALILLAGLPLALGSYWGLLVVPVGFVLLAFRIADEESMLVNELPGYRDYRRKVRYRLVPGIW
jgi:protein-S-isoprenylcysteine O-methyltransferase Ste14